MLIAGLLSAMAGCTAHEAQARDAEREAATNAGAFEDVYRKAQRAAVEVLVDGRQAGSGWFAKPAGLIVTASHVVADADGGIEVTSAEVGRIPVEKIALDPGHDLALLRAPQRDKPYPALRPAKRMPPPGAEVALFGSPLFRHALLVRGNVASDAPAAEYLPDRGHYAIVRHIAAPSPPGSSGGCWLDARGRAVACQSGMLTHEGRGAGIAMAAPASAIRQLLRRRKNVVTPTLGIVVEELPSQPVGFIRRFPDGADGLVVHRFEEDSPAADSALKREMLITHAAGNRVRRRIDLLRAVRARSPGDTIELRVRLPDDGGARTLTVPLGRIA